VAEIVSHGRSSAYLNSKVHRPLVQFTPAGQLRARRYAPLPVGIDSLESLDEARLLQLLQRAKPY
jgi:hypothetical protein